jgi:hypothetical protein
MQTKTTNVMVEGRKSRKLGMRAMGKAPLALLGILIAAASSAVCIGQIPGANQPDRPIDAPEKSAVIASLAQAIKEGYAFPDVADKLAHMLTQNQSNNTYAKVTSALEFSELLTRQLADIASDRHLHVVYSFNVVPKMHMQEPGDSPLTLDAQIMQRMQATQRRNNYAFERVERLSGNVGYLKLNEFSDAARGGDTVAGAMAFLANTDALIIDLRENLGGTPMMVQLLASYFFGAEIPVHLNDLSWRQPGSRSQEVTQWWTVPYLLGKRYVDKAVYILTSRRTFSAAEEFTYDLQVLKRATVVGETTGGGANPGGIRRIADHYTVFIPTGHAINPTTKTNWEGKGIEPDIKVPKEDALNIAYKNALQSIIDGTQDEEQLAALKQALKRVAP